MKDRKEIELNESGRLAFQNKAMPNLFAHRAFRWVDRILFLDESNGRRVVHTQSYSDFNHAGWRPVTVEEDNSVVNNYDELNKVQT